MVTSAISTPLDYVSTSNDVLMSKVDIFGCGCMVFGVYLFYGGGNEEVVWDNTTKCHFNILCICI